MLSNKKPIIEKYLEPLAAIFKPVNPNLLTLLGSIPPLFFFVFVITHHYILALIFFLGNIVDLLDGMVARKYNKTTAFGGLLDSTIDRISDFLLITAFAFGNIVRWEITAPLLLFSFLTSYIRSRGEAASNNKIIFNIGILERTERLIGLFLALFLYILVPGKILLNFNISEVIFLILLILSIYTVFQRLIYGYRKLGRLGNLN